MVVLSLKIVFFIVLAILFRGTLPRYRVDQLIALNWKFLLFSLLTFLLEVYFLYMFFGF